MNNLHVHNLQSMWLCMPVIACVRRDGAHVIVHYCMPADFYFPPPLILHYDVSMNEKFVWFFLQLSGAHSYNDFARSIFWSEHMAFFHLGLTEEIISDWE